MNEIKIMDYIPGDKKNKIVGIIILCLYVIFELNIDFIVKALISYDAGLIRVDVRGSLMQEQLRLLVQTVLLEVVNIGLFIYVFIVSFQIINDKSIPPKRVKFPFGMNRISGVRALYIGSIFMLLCILQIIASCYRLWENYSLVS